ncbi:GTP-binding protein At3g49725, chloroplastic [Arachis stenosperma]|uniref:GTP-binding protein At3g49725, chloroplastic n=1 Tax=Arachis stenosperma TaxID=217475 RepID=UPI0025AC2D75|nr:GTP-binding protein At3g49725, chloroplastic [Arachis stenosperma]
MLRTLLAARSSLRSSRKILTSLSSPPFKCWAPSYSSKQGNDDSHETVSFLLRDTALRSRPPRLLVVQPRLRPDRLLQAKLNEALCLANSLEEQRDGYFLTDFFDKELPPHIVVQNPSMKGHKARADAYFGPGTVHNIKCHLNNAESKGEVDAVFVNAILSGVQQRNLERAWDKPVLDRVGLIIEIFNAHAFTKEAKLQAELAALTYKKSRLVRVRGPGGRYTFGAAGDAEVVSARGRGSGGQGFMSGAGETELQLQRRRILERRNYLLSQIEEVRRTRAIQRAGRKRHGGSFGQGLATVAVVGYTNAGKSTLVSELSNSDLYSDCRLFATVDPRLRSAVLPSGRKMLFSDTVGFISDLPIQLVEAFHATLEEVVEADLLVHVVDSSAPNLDEHRSTVFQVLQQIGVSEEKLLNMIEVWNKIDIEEECTDADEADKYLDEDEESDVKSMATESETDVCEQSRGEYEAMEEKENYSDGWLYDEVTMVDESDFGSPSNADDQQNEQPNKNKISETDSLIGQNGPHVKTSAVTGVGLQELLELIDEKLSAQDDEKLKGAKIVERNIFERKWRPSHTQEDSTIAAEQ